MIPAELQQIADYLSKIFSEVKVTLPRLVMLIWKTKHCFSFPRKLHLPSNSFTLIEGN